MATSPKKRSVRARTKQTARKKSQRLAADLPGIKKERITIRKKSKSKVPVFRPGKELMKKSKRLNADLPGIKKGTIGLRKKKKKK